MDVKLQDCFLAVDDHDRAVAFYRDALGFEVRNDVKAYGMRWVTVGPPSQPDINIVLEPPAADPGISASDRETIADLLAKGLLRGLNFSSPDVDATFERVQATGAEVIQEPMDQGYGRDCAFRDPAGNMIRIIQARD
ncbi:MAG TPA: VOC family protein [Candidatus Limnocylindria bacterium]|nr:VOC family protein [Candidatus Limnocylindria bacterium]